MQTFTYEINDPVGIHARPAGLLVKEASKFQSEIIMVKDDKEADCKKLFSVMSLAVKKDDKITVKITGSDEAGAAKELQQFFKDNL